MSLLYTRLSDDDLKKKGWDIQWIDDDAQSVGPYLPIRAHVTCGCCSHKVFGYTVVNIETGEGINETWSDDDGGISALDHAGILNHAWREGRRQTEEAGAAWRHKVRGTTYLELARATMQVNENSVTDDAEVVVYQSREGVTYVRLFDDFMDGRFERVPPEEFSKKE